MFRRGLALCIALGLFSAANAQTVNITLVPNNPGPYAGGEQVLVDVNLTLTGAGGSKLARLVQVDVRSSAAELLSSAVYQNLGGASFGFWDFSSLAICPGSCGQNHIVEPVPSGARTNIGSIVYHGLVANAAEQILLDDGVAKRIGQVRVTLPVVPGNYNLNFAGSGAAPDEGARVVYGFGVIQDDDATSLTVGNGGVTGGVYTFVIDGGNPAVLAGAFPPPNNGINPSTLWRATKNRVRISLDKVPDDPFAAGDFEIVEMLAGGGFGADVSGTFTVTTDPNDASGQSVVLQDTASALTNKTYYRVRSTVQNNIDVDICYLVQAGDASGDRFVNFADLVNINMSIPTLPQNINDTNRRRDINGDNFINFADMVVANGFIPALGVPVPAGHTCP